MMQCLYSICPPSSGGVHPPVQVHRGPDAEVLPRGPDLPRLHHDRHPRVLLWHRHASLVRPMWTDQPVPFPHSKYIASRFWASKLGTLLSLELCWMSSVLPCYNVIYECSLTGEIEIFRCSLVWNVYFSNIPIIYNPKYMKLISFSLQTSQFPGGCVMRNQ